MFVGAMLTQVRLGRFIKLQFEVASAWSLNTWLGIQEFLNNLEVSHSWLKLWHCSAIFVGLARLQPSSHPSILLL